MSKGRKRERERERKKERERERERDREKRVGKYLKRRNIEVERGFEAGVKESRNQSYGEKVLQSNGRYLTGDGVR